MKQRATIFEFTSYQFEPAKKRATFHYKTDFKEKESLFFTETIILPQVPNIDTVPVKLLGKLFEGLHLILGISYYKLYCATKVRHSYALTKGEADFWNSIYKNGLGEFFYKNKLDPKISPRFPYIENRKAISYPIPTTNYSLVAMGGGKDSIVSAELLKEHGFQPTAFFVETNKKSELIEEVIRIAGLKQIKIQRFLDSQVQQPHQYNGHIPISAVYAFLGLLSAVLYGYKYIIVSNEHSSNFGNITYKGLDVNHQWSKSFEFETLFQEYVKNFITPNVAYFSLMRPFYEIRIVKMFSKMRQYFPYFSSCNRNFKIDTSKELLIRENKQSRTEKLWCNNCAKCVFAFIMLSAFLLRKELFYIFKKNLYQDEKLLPLFKDILGLGAMKPFDCVGTFEEAQTTFSMAHKKFAKDFIVKELHSDILNNIRMSKTVFTTIRESAVPEQFRFLGMENALILGYGKEGKITKEYLKKYYPKVKISVADVKQESNYLKNQEKFDIAVKTPGIKKELVTIPYTTATNIFFSKVLGKNMIIGVTGSKGKSTTSSLIFEILKTAGKRVVLLGNIGKPMLEYLLNPVDKNTIFVLELSSYQLDDIKFSPDIAVVTNLFPEHMDYHGNIENYFEAKKNIIKFQNGNNHFIYDPKNNMVSAWLKEYKGKAIPFNKNTPVQENETTLKGTHNQNNIKAAIVVVKLLNIHEATIKKAIRNFKSLPHRLQFVGKFKGIIFYDDGSSTNPESAILAIRALRNIGTILLGGEDRGYDFSKLEKVIKQYKIKNIILFPDSGKKILKSKKGLNILHTSSMQKAVAFAYMHTEKGKSCLLSGASPSYSLWKNFDEKGNQYQEAVKKLSKK